MKKQRLIPYPNVYPSPSIVSSQLTLSTAKLFSHNNLKQILFNFSAQRAESTFNSNSKLNSW
jgi:hypothetical protein